MARGEQVGPKPRSATGELESFKRLVQLQRELVELACKNEDTKIECEALWRELAPAPRPARVAGARWPRVLARWRRLALAEYANRLSTLVRAAQFVFKPAAK